MSYDPEQDLRALEAMAANLTPYLYESEIFGALSNSLPKLTVGGILLRRYRLMQLSESLDHQQQQRLHDALLNFEQQRSEWMVHYEEKLQQEAQARLRNLQAFNQDYQRDWRQVRDNHLTVASNRTIVYHVHVEAETYNAWEPSLHETLNRVDRGLGEMLEQGGEFVWDAALQPLYPAETFWWLYGKPAPK